MKYGQEVTIQYQVSKDDTIIISLGDKLNGQSIGTTATAWQDKVFAKTGGDKYTYIEDKNISFMHKINNNVSIMTSNITIDSILGEDGKVAASKIDTSATGIWSDEKQNTAIIDIDGTSGDLSTYISGVTFDGSGEASLKYGQEVTIQYQVSKDDMVIIGLDSSIYGMQITATNWQTTIFEKDTAGKYKYVTDDSVSYMHKINYNVTIMTSNITIDNILSNGKIKSAITADWSKTDKNTVIIGDKAGNSLYLIGVNVTGDGTDAKPYEISATAGTSVRLSTRGENGYDYAYTAKLGDDIVADISTWTIENVLGDVDVNTGNLSVSYEDTKTGITYTYSQTYNSALDYEAGVKINIEAVFNEGYNGLGKTNALLKLSDNVSIMTTNWLSYNKDTGFIFQDAPVIVSKESLDVSKLFENSDTNIAVISEGTSSLYITKVSLDDSGYTIKSNSNSVVQLSETIGNITYSVSAGLKTKLDDIDGRETITDFFNSNNGNLGNAVGSVSIKYGSQMVVSTSNVSIGKDFKFDTNTKTFNFDAITYNFNVASKNSLTIGTEPNQLILNGLSVTESNGNISSISTLKNTVAVVRKEGNGITYTFTSQLTDKMDIETSTSIKEVFNKFDTSKQTFTASYTGSENKVVATSNIINAGIDCDASGNITFTGKVVVYISDTDKYELYSTGSSEPKVGTKTFVTGDSVFNDAVSGVKGLARINFGDSDVEFYIYTNDVPCNDTVLFGTNYVYKSGKDSNGYDIIYINMGVEKTGEKVDFRIGTYELDVAEKYSEPIIVSVKINTTTLTVDSTNGTATSRYGKNTYDLTDFGSLPFTTSKFTNPSMPTDPFEIPIKTVSTTVKEIVDETQPTGYREKGFVTNRVLTSYAFADVTNRTDCQYQVVREISFDGTTFKGAAKHSITNEAVSNTFLGYDTDGNKLSGTYSEVFSKSNMGIEGQETGLDNFSHATITGKDGVLIGVYDENCTEPAHYFTGIKLKQKIAEAKETVGSQVEGLDNLDASTLKGMSYNKENMEVTDIVFYVGGVFNAQVTIEVEFEDSDGTVYAGTSVIGVANLENDLDSVYSGISGPIISSEVFNGYNENKEKAFTHKREFGEYKEDNNQVEFSKGAKSATAYYTTIERKDVGTSSEHTEIIKEAKASYSIPLVNGGTSKDKVISTIDENKGLVIEDKITGYTTANGSNENDVVVVEYSYNQETTLDPSTLAQRDVDSSNVYHKEENVKVNIAKITTGNRDLGTVYIDSLTGELRYQKTLSGQDITEKMIVYSAVSEKILNELETNEDIDLNRGEVIIGNSYEKLSISRTTTTKEDAQTEVPSYTEDRYRYFERPGNSNSYYLIQFMSFGGDHGDNVLLKTNIYFNEKGEMIDDFHDKVEHERVKRLGGFFGSYTNDYVYDWFTGECTDIVQNSTPGTKIMIDGTIYAENNNSASGNPKDICSYMNNKFNENHVTAAGYFENGLRINVCYGDYSYFEFSRYNSDGSITKFSSEDSGYYAYSWTKNGLNYISCTGDYFSNIDMKFDINKHAYYYSADADISAESVYFCYAVFENYDNTNRMWTGYNVDSTGSRIPSEVTYKASSGRNGAVYTSITRDDCGNIKQEMEVSFSNASNDIKNIKVTSNGNVSKFKIGEQGVLREFTKQEYEAEHRAGIIAACVAVAASIIITIASFGTLTGVVGTAWAIAGSIIGTTISCYFAATSAYKAGVCAYNGDWGGFALNGFAALVSVLGTSGLNSAIANFGAKITAQIMLRAGKEFGKETLGTVGAELAAAKVAAKAGGQEIAKLTLKETIKQSIGAAAAKAGMSSWQYVLSSSWTVRAGILVTNSVLDLVFTGLHVTGWFADLTKILSLQGMVGWSTLSEDSFFNKEILDIKLSSLVWVAGYVIAPGMISRGIRTAIINNNFENLRLGKEITLGDKKVSIVGEGGYTHTIDGETYTFSGNTLKVGDQQIKLADLANLDKEDKFNFVGTGLKGIDDFVDYFSKSQFKYGYGQFFNNNKGKFIENFEKGVKQAGSNFGQLFGGGATTLLDSRWDLFFDAWGKIALNTYRMTILNIGMNGAGYLLNKSNILRGEFGSTPLGSLLNFVFSDMGGQMKDWHDIFNLNMGFSSVFGAVMFVAMPIVAGFAEGIKAQFFTSKKELSMLDRIAKLAEKTTESAAEKLDRLTINIKDKLLSVPRDFVQSIWEEGFKENMVQAIAMGFGVTPEVAEYISEFAFPDGDINVNINEILTADYKTKAGATETAKYLQQQFDTKFGKGSVTVTTTQNSTGNYGITITNAKGSILSTGIFSSRTDLQNYMMGVLNTIQTFNSNMDFKDKINIKRFSSNIQANIQIIADIRNNMQSHGILKTIRDTVWNGETRTFGDFIPVISSVANIVQKYGVKEGNIYGFNRKKFISGIGEVRTISDVRKVFSEVKAAGMISNGSMGLDSFITGTDIIEIIDTVKTKAADSGISQQQIDAEILELGATLKYNGFTDVQKVTKPVLGKGLIDLDVRGLTQFQKLNTHVNILDAKGTTNLAIEVKSVRDTIRSGQSKFRGVRDAKKLAMINDILQDSPVTKLDNARRELAEAEAILANAGDTMMALDSSYDALAAELPQLKARVAEAKSAVTPADEIIFDYFISQLTDVNRDIVSKNKNDFVFVQQHSSKGYELVQRDNKFEAFINGNSYGLFDIAALFGMGIIDSSNIEFSYSNENQFVAKLTVPNINSQMTISGLDMYSLLQNTKFRDSLSKFLGENNNKVLKEILGRDISGYSAQQIRAELEYLKVKDIKTDAGEARQQLIDKLVEIYSDNLENFVLSHTRMIAGNLNADSLRLVSQKTIDDSRKYMYKVPEGNDSFREIRRSLPDAVAMYHGLGVRLEQLSTERKITVSVDDILKAIETPREGGKSLAQQVLDGDFSQAQDGTELIEGITLKDIADFVGFGGDNVGLIVRLHSLGQYKNSESKDLDHALEVEKQNKKWFEQHRIGEGKGLKVGDLDVYRTYVKRTYSNEAEQLLAIRLFVNQMLMESGIYKGSGARASQMELLSALLGNENVALDMGGGKTISLVMDAIEDRILMGDKANFEILVGNGAIQNYVGTDMQVFLQFVGMDMVAITDYKTSNGTKAKELLEAYNDPNKVMIMDPTTRGHLKNDAANGGETGKLIDSALNSVRRVVTDEIHLWALTRTASVISNGSYATSDTNIKSARNMYDSLNVEEMLNNLKAINNYQRNIIISSKLGQFEVGRFRSFNDWIKYRNEHSDRSIMAMIGESSADIQVVFNGDIETNVNNDSSINNGEVLSFVRGLFTASDMGGAAFGADGTVKPVSTKVENDMVIGDIFFQMGYAANAWALQSERTGKYNNLEEFIKAATRESDTSMQTSLAAIYDGADQLLSLIGVSGTVLGLQQLIINRTGSGKVYMVSGGRANIQGQEITNKTGQALINEIHEQIKKALNENKDTDVLMLAKTAPSISVFMEAIKSLDSDTLAKLEAKGFVIFDRTTDTKYEIKDGKLIEADYKKHYDKETGELKTDEANRDQTAKNENIRKIIIDNDAGATGTDYQGNYYLFVLDSHMYSNTDLAQLLQRIGRPDPAGTGRGDAKRFILQDTSAVQSKLTDYLANRKFVDFFTAASAGKEGAFLQNSRATELFEEIIVQQNSDGSFEIKADILEAMKNGDRQIQKDVLELTTFMTEISSINASIRFAVSDAIRDRMIIKPLRTMLANAQTVEERTIIRNALDKVLGKAEYDSNADLKGRDSAQETDSDDGIKYIQDTIDSVTKQARELFDSLMQNLKSTSALYAQIAGHLAEIDTLDMSKTIDISKQNLAKIDAGENIDSLSQAENLEQFMGTIMTFERYIAPSLAAKMMEVSTVTNETVQQDLQTDWAMKNGLVVEQNGKVYLTQLGQNYVKLAQNSANAKSNAVASVIGILLQLLLGGGYQQPPEEKDMILDLAKALQDKGITNVSAINDIINISLVDTSLILKIEDIMQLKKVVDTRSPIKEISDQTARLVALKKIAGIEDDMVKEYDNIASIVGGQQYGLTKNQKYQILKGKLDNSLVLSSISKLFEIFFNNTVGFIPRLALMGVFGKAFDLLSGGLIKQGTIPNSLSSIAATDAIIPKQNRRNQQDISVIEPLIVNGFVSIIDFFGKAKDSLSYKKSLNTINSLVNPTLADFSEKTTDEIKAAMAQAGIPITAGTDKAISNMLWIQENEPDLFREMKLSDVYGLEKLTGLISIAKTDKNFSLALDYDILQQITSGQRTVLEVYNPELAEKLARNVLGIKDLDSLGKSNDKLNTLIDNKAKILTSKDITVAMLKEAAEEMDLDMGYIMALILPEISYNSKIIPRYNTVKNTNYAKYAKVSDLNEDDNFTNEGTISDKYEKELTLIMPFGETSNTQLKQLGYGLVISKAKEIVEKLGGGKQAQQFVNGLSLGVLNDKDFVKELTKLISKTSREARKIKASEIYGNEELAGKINAVYKENHASVDKNDKLGQLIESEYATKVEIIKAKKNNPDMSMIYSRQEIKEIMAVMPQMDKVTEQEAVEIERILEDIVNGVTAPGEMNEAVSAVLAICKDADAIAQLIGFRNAGEAVNVTREEIVSRYNEKIGEIVMLEGVGKDDMQASIKILSVARDMMVMVNKDSRAIEELNNAVTAEDIINKLVISKAVNQNVVTGLVKDAVLKADKDKPAIDVEKLRKAVTEKKIEKNAKDKLKELAAMLGNGSGRGSAANSMPVALMQLSDFRAIAAAA